MSPAAGVWLGGSDDSRRSSADSWVSLPGSHEEKTSSCARTNRRFGSAEGSLGRLFPH